MQWFGRAAEQGHAKAQYNFGVMYANGEGVRQNYKIAKEWFGKACDNGIQLGCDAYRELNQKGY
ncbi:tetratricopeptide repeat protein [Neisseria perflava]|uniref:tetratricopeptide repeat protein n=1 Tax=Neisseria perflava TaxID=33053 RepID=UPI003CCBC28F